MRKPLLVTIFIVALLLLSTHAQAEITFDADNRIEIHQNENIVIAYGNAKVQKDGKAIIADKITSFYAKDANNKIAVDKIIAEGNVKITTQEATVTADKGEYILKEDIVKLYNNVTISQDGNNVKGDYAETNLKTGISKLISNKSGGRVSGVFKEKK